MQTRPLIGITMGDPASIGPEIAAKALNNPEMYELCRPILFGDSRVMARAFETTGVRLDLHPVASPAEGKYRHGTIDLVDIQLVDMNSLKWGEVQAPAGAASFAYIKRAIELAREGAIDAVTTGPINKEALKAADIDFIGHTEMFGAFTGSHDPLTMFETRGLRIFFLTRHVALAEAIRMITRERVLDYIRRCTAALRQLGLERPKLAVAGLNPHGGEHGLFGDEEVREIEPAIQAAQAEGYDVSGPYPADSVFWHAAQGRFDAVLSLYHDQGHIAAKMYDFERTVSITLGLPFLRSSVDHGTAFDIAGTGKASSVSLEEAIRVAAKYASAFRRAG